MPTLFVLLAQRLGLEATFAASPEHYFVKYRDETGRWYNLVQTFTTEATHSAFSDSEYAAAMQSLEAWEKWGIRSNAFLIAAACSSSDVVVMLEKMDVRLASLSVDVAGIRREEEPRRYVAIQLTYRVRGDGLDETKARRAVGLAVEKYCSVIASLAPDLRVSYDVVLI